MFVLIPLEITLDVGGEESIARLPTVAAGILPCLDTEPVLSAVGLLDIDGANLWNLEGTQPDERAELDDEVVALTGGRSSEVLNLGVSELHFVLVSSSRFDTQYDYFTSRY